jgi:simple sugar transport system ATP-binding protein
MSVAAAAPAVNGGSAPMRAPTLETTGMTKVFGPLVALDNVSIKVEPGTVHALLGENGAGKSTLVKCIMGFYSPDKGQVLLDGHEADPQPARCARARHRHGVPAIYSGAVADRRRESRDQPR